MFAFLQNKLFYLLLLLLLLVVVVCCILCDGVHAVSSDGDTLARSPPSADNNKNKNSVELLQVGNVNIALKPDGTNEDKKNIFVRDYYSPFLVSAGNVLLALAGVNRSNDASDKNITIISKYIVTTGKNIGWGSEVVSDSKTNSEWKTQFVVQGKLKDGETSMVKGMLAAAKESKIYVLLVNCSNKNNGESNNDANCDFNITVGAVSNDEATSKKITWKDDEEKKIKELTTKLQKEQPTLYSFGGSAFLTADEKVVFVGLIETEKKKNVFVVIYSEGVEGQTEFKLSKEESVDGCTPSFFLWEKNIIMMPTQCNDDGKNQKVKELSDMEGSWSDSTGPFARMLGFMRDKSNFTTTKIGETNILLFTQMKSKSTENAGTKNDAHVWFTDGRRVHSVGRIVTDDNITSASLLHTNNELFALHQNWDDKGQHKNITLTRMEEQLGNITSVISAWKNSDEVVTKLFKETFALSEALKATDGLVGFLSNNSESNKSWTDEYYCVNATVTKGEKVNGGFTFNEKGAGAQWPVGKPKEDQPYNFTDPGFTLVVNVTIDDGDTTINNDKGNSVLGVVYKESTNDEKTFGLWCTAKGEWKLTGNGGSHETILTTPKECLQGSTYIVGLILNNTKLSVYIDGEVLGEKESEEMKIGNAHNITHFYFGANEQKTTNTDESHVTVRNVLLYNRPFTKDEIGKLKTPKKRKPSETKNDSFTDDKTDDDNNTHGGNEISTDKGGDEKSPSLSSRTGEVEEKSTSQPESSTVRGGYVAVFVCFVILAHALCFL